MRVEKECGYIEFELPDIAEGMILFGKMGIDPEGIKKKTDEEINEDFIYIGKLIKNCGYLVTKLELKGREGKVYTSYGEAIKDFTMIEIVTAMATEIAKSLRLDVEKK